MNFVKKNVSILFVVMMIAVLVSLGGCVASQRTTGKGHKWLPFEIGFHIGGALAEGESETKVGLGKESVPEVMRADSGFNLAWAEAAVAESENQIQTVTYSGPPQTNPNLNYSSSAVQGALEMEK